MLFRTECASYAQWHGLMYSTHVRCTAATLLEATTTSELSAAPFPPRCPSSTTSAGGRDAGAVVLLVRDAHCIALHRFTHLCWSVPSQSIWRPSGLIKKQPGYFTTLPRPCACPRPRFLRSAALMKQHSDQSAHGCCFGPIPCPPLLVHTHERRTVPRPKRRAAKEREGGQITRCHVAALGLIVRLLSIARSTSEHDDVKA